MKADAVFTPEELLYFAALTGASDLRGIADGFAASGGWDAARQIRLVQKSLAEKGFVHKGPGTGSQILGAVSVCALCDAFMALDISHPRYGVRCELFYRKDGRIVQLAWHPLGRKIKSLAGQSELFDSITASLHWQSAETTDEPAIVVKRALLAKAKAETAADGVVRGAGLLKAGGLSADISAALCASLGGMAGYCTIVVTDCRTNRETFSAVFADSPGGIYSLQDAGADMVKISPLSRRQAEDMLKKEVIPLFSPQS